MPSRPTTWPETACTAQELLDQIAPLEVGVVGKELRRRQTGVGLLLAWLAVFPGTTWQQRWLASGSDTAGRTWTEHVDVAGLLPGVDGRRQLTGAAGRLIVLGALRPGYDWLYRAGALGRFSLFRSLRDPEGFATLDGIWEITDRATGPDRSLAYHQLCRILIHNGGKLADISLADCIEAYRAQVGYTARQHGHWYLLLREVGILPADSPPTIWAASRRGQLTVDEMVDGYQVAYQPMRELLIDYLHERQAAMDYTSLRQLSTKLVLLFWKDLELHEPGIESLHLSEPAARRWKERLKEVTYGRHRVGQLREDPNTILMAVRAFYADLTHWALEDPDRWARWSAPSPISGRDLLGQNKLHKRIRARMQERTRGLLPVLPVLVKTAIRRRQLAQQLLAAATDANAASEFEIHGQRWLRVALVSEAPGGSARPGLVYAVDLSVGERHNLTLEEDNAFWSWAIIEVLRHTGVRIEELLELTHRSFVPYSLPTTGELVPLLQITPSKTDRERLLVVSPELSEVLAAIIDRGSAGRACIPLISRYDQRERLHSPPLPFLFQRPYGLRTQTLTHGYVKQLLDATVAASGLTSADGQPLGFTPHDFRRIFVTEAVAAGLPVHIAAKLLGHESLNTTQGYLAIYDSDVIDHHRAFIARRRALRPSEEYREPTDGEWNEFLAHFEKRKVELGVCGRAYGTPCIHEHACLRCPLLRPDAGQVPRLIEIQQNLHARLKEAHQRGWLGEVEGLEVSLAGAEQKLASMRAKIGATAPAGT